MVLKTLGGIEGLCGVVHSCVHAMERLLHVQPATRNRMKQDWELSEAKCRQQSRMEIVSGCMVSMCFE